MSRNIFASLVALLIAADAFAGSTGLSTQQGRTAAPVSVNLSGVAAAEGSSLSFARADHVHAISGPTCSTGQVLTSNGTGLSCVTAGFYGPAQAPATTDSRSDEFGETPSYTAPPTGWTITAIPTGSPANYLSNPSAGVNFDLGHGRPGWLLVQTAPGSGAELDMYKPISLDANDIVWARVSSTLNSSSSSPYSGHVCLIISDAAKNNSVQICLNDASNTPTPGTIQASYYNGSNHFVASAQQSDSRFAASNEYFLIMKTGTTYSWWISGGNEAGNWTWLATVTSLTFTPGLVDFSFYSNAPVGTDAGDVMGVDFIRVAATNQLP